MPRGEGISVLLLQKCCCPLVTESASAAENCNIKPNVAENLLKWLKAEF